MNYSSLSKLKSHINSSIVLIFFTMLALVCANTPIIKEWYFSLWQIADYSCRLNVEESNPEKRVEEFINFLPVLA